MPTVCQCSHCGHRGAPIGGTDKVKCPLFCRHCSTKEKRDTMDKENEELGLGKCDKPMCKRND